MRLLIIFILLTNSVFGQTTLADQEKELWRLGEKSISAKTEEERLAVADTFTNLLDMIIGTKASFEFPFEKVKNLSKLISPDKNFRIYTWSVPLRNGSFKYFGRLVLKEDEKFRVVKLIDAAATLENPEHRQLKPDQWYGAIYYDLVKTKHKKKTYYTLIGYRPDKSSHNEKVLEVLSTNNFDPIRFGEKIFNTPRLNEHKYQRRPYRLIFRYNPTIVASLKYIPQRKEIVFDHLAPPDASQHNQWHLYGPDFTFDALYWEKDNWELNEGIQVNNSISPSTPVPTEKGLPKR